MTWVYLAEIESRRDRFIARKEKHASAYIQCCRFEAAVADGEAFPRPTRCTGLGKVQLSTGGPFCPRGDRELSHTGIWRRSEIGAEKPLAS